jgi:hypothetical protein
MTIEEKTELLSHNLRAYSEMLANSAKEIEALITILDIRPDAESEGTEDVFKAAILCLKFITTDLQIAVESLKSPL